MNQPHRPQVSDDGNRRCDLVGTITAWTITLLMLVVLGRVVQLELAPGDRLRAMAAQHTGRWSNHAARGDIVDRRGRLIATTTSGYRLFIDPSEFPTDRDAAFDTIAEASGIDRRAIAERVIPKLIENLKRLDDGRTPLRYVSVGGILEPDRVEALRRLEIDGVHLERRPVRITPSGDIAAAIVGKVGIDDNGLLGAERTFEDELQPDQGSLAFIHDARGRPMWIDTGAFAQANSGEPITLSIDLMIQETALEELRRGVEDADAAGGRAIVLDPVTGEILAMVDVVREIPGAVEFKPELARDAFENGVRFRVIRDDPGRRVHPAMARNRCVEDAYEPGSTFKPFIWSSVVELGLADPDEVLDAHHGRWKTSYGRPLEDVTPKEKLSVSDVLVYSSNIGMYQLADRMSFAQARAAIKRFGFGARTGVGLPGESAGLVTSERDWSKYTQTSVAMGYEVAVTPVQIVRAFAALARTGELAGVMPELSLTAVDPREPLAFRHRVLAPGVVELARTAMGGVVARLDEKLDREHRLDTPPVYSMFGKSGTAKQFRPDGRGYYDHQYVSSFIAGAPTASPRIVVLVVIDDPGPALIRLKQHYGSAVAGPVVRRIVERTLPYLGVAPAAPDAASTM